MEELLEQISACTICSPYLPLGPRPVVTAHPTAKIAIIGQAPGTAVHKSGIPWDDKSGENLRAWTEISHEVFYDSRQVALVPMGFCYPGKGKSGDLPPRKECAPQWHPGLMEQMPELKLILLVGKYAQDYYLKEGKKRTLTATVQAFREYLPQYFVLPHPSPRNNIWMKKNPWFAEEVIPSLKRRIVQSLT